MAEDALIPEAAVAEVNQFLDENPDRTATIVSGHLVIRKRRKAGRRRGPAAPRLILTDEMIAGLPQPESYALYRDVTEGLVLQVGRKVKTWQFRAEMGRGGQKMGNYPKMSISEARSIAKAEKEKLLSLPAYSLRLTT